MDERQGQGQKRVDAGGARLRRAEWLGLRVSVNGDVVRGDGIDGAVRKTFDDGFAVILGSKWR